MEGDHLLRPILTMPEDSAPPSGQPTTASSLAYDGNSETDDFFDAEDMADIHDEAPIPHRLVTYIDFEGHFRANRCRRS